MWEPKKDFAVDSYDFQWWTKKKVNRIVIVIVLAINKNYHMMRQLIQALNTFLSPIFTRFFFNDLIDPKRKKKEKKPLLLMASY